MATTIKDILKEVNETTDGVSAPERKAALIIAASNLELAKSNLMIAEAQRSVATAIEDAGNKIYKGFCHISDSIDRMG